MSTPRPVLAPYLEALERLGRQAWLNSPASRQRSIAPVWFQELVVARGMALLNLVLDAPEPWVVFPDVVPGFAAIALRKTPQRMDIPPLDRLQLRFFHGREALDMDHLVQNALASLVRRRLREQPGVLRFSDAQFLVFLMPSARLNPALLHLGLPAHALEQHRWINPKDVDWAAAGLG